jgi:hypothetical protein
LIDHETDSLLLRLSLESRAGMNFVFAEQPEVDGPVLTHQLYSTPPSSVQSSTLSSSSSTSQASSPTTYRNRLLYLLTNEKSLFEGWPRDLFSLIVDYAVARLLLVMNYCWDVSKAGPFSSTPWKKQKSGWTLLACSPFIDAPVTVTDGSISNNSNERKRDGWLQVSVTSALQSSRRDQGQGRVIGNGSHIIWYTGQINSDEAALFDIHTRTWIPSYRHKLIGDHQYCAHVVDPLTGDWLVGGGVRTAKGTHSFNPRKVFLFLCCSIPY